MSDALNLTDVLNKIHKSEDGDKIKVEQILDTFKHRGYGPLLLVPALISILPTGAIPGVPAITKIKSPPYFTYI